MRAVVQRVSRASVTVEGEVAGAIDIGLVVLLGVAEGDRAADATLLADKVVGLRVFPDEQGKMNRSLAEVEGEALVVSQFTLLGDVRRGRRPSFTGAASPDEAVRLIEVFVEQTDRQGIRVAQGVFGAKMDVELVNDGPVTLTIDVRQGSIV